MPPVPAFYSRPHTLDDIVNHTVGRVLDLFSIEHGDLARWEGMQGALAGETVELKPLLRRLRKPR